MQFEVPPFLKGKIAEDDEVQATVSMAMATMYPWFLDNKLLFFPEFTDHGVDHINTVLTTVESLISKDARGVFSPQDAGAIAIAVLLHDCAMHLSWDGFRTLVSGEYVASSALLPADAPSWPELFRTFMHRAIRWDQKKLLQVVGAVNAVREPPERLIDSTEVDKRVIGEFIRMHHARLAHEIAILGVPGPIGNRTNWLKPITGNGLPADLVGFIAQSHNLTIRQASDTLPRLRLREYNGIHAPYVMALLRIADYLQIQSKRAHPSLMAIRSLSSTISSAEWKKHAATVDIHPHGDDPEALIVQTDPEDISTLFSLRNLFRSMQQELDDTWACLGEVYGRHESFEDIAYKGLTVRRLNTNIDSLQTFERETRPSYLPIDLRLRSAGADMFGLLVKPLYDGDASVAVRELVQNSVDACNERNAYELSTNRTTTECKINVKLVVGAANGDPSYLEVSDNGIGMTLETVRDYYLVAGASFRKSGWWKDHFVSNDGKSAVRRSGRFGVGALASFLVGNRTTVITRHIDEKQNLGIGFTYEIEDGLIEARHVVAPVGTTIRIEISSSEVVQYLKEFRAHEGYRTRAARYHWYGLNQPHVTCEIHEEGKSTTIKKTFSVPSPKEPLPQGWREFSHPDFQKIHWSFTKLTTRENSSYGRDWLLCNGILVSEDWARESSFDIEISPQSPTINLQHPTISVFDQDGLLPLNLSRNNLASDGLPFKKELQESMANWLASSARKAWLSAGSDIKAINAVESINGLQHRYYGSNISGYLARSPRGACFLDAHLMSMANFDRLIFVPKTQLVEHYRNLTDYLVNHNGAAIPIEEGLDKKSGIEAHFRYFLEMSAHGMAFFNNLGRQLTGIRIFCSSEFIKIAQEKGRVPKYLFHDWSIEKISSDRVELKMGQLTPSKDYSAELLSSHIDGKTIFAEFTYGEAKDKAVGPTALSRAWLALDSVTPFFPAKSN